MDQINPKEKISFLKDFITVQNKVSNVHKTGKNDHDNYTYATLSDYYNTCKSILNENGFTVTESIEKHEFITGRQTRGGVDQYASNVKLNLSIHHRDGYTMTFSSVGEGQDRADKSTYKAITGARKYAIAMAMNLSTSDDPESDESVGVGNAKKMSIPNQKKYEKDSLDDFI